MNPTDDPFISPIYLSDEILAKFPKCKIIVGTNDALHDDCWRLVERFDKLNVDV